MSYELWTSQLNYLISKKQTTKHQHGLTLLERAAVTISLPETNYFVAAGEDREYFL